MSGWHPSDIMLAEEMDDDFPAINNITIPGQLPSEKVPAPRKFTPHSCSFSYLFSSIEIGPRGPLKESESLQKVVQIHALHRGIHRVQAVRHCRASQGLIGRLLEI